MKKNKAASINAQPEDGSARSSVEVAVMAAERRGRVVLVGARANSLGRMNA